METIQNWPQREDRYQLISYMYLMQKQKGGFVVPARSETFARQEGTLRGHGGTIGVCGLQVAHKAESFSDYCRLMAVSEKMLLSVVAK